MDEELSPLELIQAKRAARKAEEAKLREEQLVQDLTAIDELEAEYGASSIKVLELPYTPGFPAAVAVRTPNKAELKRYRDRFREDVPDIAAANSELGAATRIYPAKEVLEALAEKRPAVYANMGLAAAQLGSAREEAEKKG